MEKEGMDSSKLWIMISALMLVALLLSLSSDGAGGEKDGEIDTLADVPKSTRLAMFRAQEERQRGNVERSTEILLGCLNGHPDKDHFLLRFHLANSLSQEGRYEEAIVHYQKSVDMEDRFSQGWLNLGELAYNTERYDLAARAITRGFETSEDKRPHALFYAAAAYMMAGDPASAVGNMERLVSGEFGTPKLDWYRALIAACVDLGDQDRGRAAVDALLEDFGDTPEAWTLAFQYAASISDYRAAAVTLTVKGYLFPLTREETLQLGDLYNAVEAPFVAARYYERAIADSSSPGDFERLASAYLAAHESEKAYETIRGALEENETVRLWSLLGDLHFMEKNYRESYAAFENCIRLDKDYGRGYLVMGYCAIQLGRVEDASGYLMKAATFPEYEDMAAQLLKRIDTDAG
ncbi:MAG: tetratricopeptide repeat protein [bacterium]|jgi:tetratricopeptide (TPR) repeat protein